MWADEQLEALLNTPNVTPRVVEIAKQYPAHMAAVDRARAQEMTQRRRADDEETTKRLSAQVASDQSRLEEIGEAVRRGTLAPLDAAGEINQILSRLGAAERRHAALVASAERSKEIEQDPTAYRDAFYERYPALQDRRYTLGEFIADRLT